jgi:hypothetical protein
VTAFPRVGSSFFDDPDVTVIGPDGKRLEAKYIGLDAVTGLSILKLTEKNAITSRVISDEPVSSGEVVLVFGPEPVIRARALLGGGGGLYARMGAIEGRIMDVMVAPSGGVSRLKLIAPKISRANIGGVALNEAGETIGILDGLEGDEASI